jgi:hypothetical protein
MGACRSRQRCRLHDEQTGQKEDDQEISRLTFPFAIDSQRNASKAMGQHMTTTQTHDQDQRELEALRFSARAARAITTLEMQRKTITREYGERIKKIRALILILQQRESIGQLGIDGINAVEISPELKKLIHNPVGDLT